MTQKNKGKGGSKPDFVALVRRNLARQDFKQALKDAKTAWRQQPTAELRALLEEAYLARTKQLLRFGLMAEARSTFEDLLSLGITEGKVRGEAAAVATPLGLVDRLLARQGPSEGPLDGATLVGLTDAAVVHPGTTVQGHPQIARDAAAVRQVLDQLAAGQGEEALAALAHIPRHSPLADWRLFARGLAAYYRQDDQQMQACWSRLDPTRWPAKIARALQDLADWIGSGPFALDRLGPGRMALLKLESLAFGQPVLTRLYELHGQMLEGDWEGAFRTLRTLPRQAGAQRKPLALMVARAVLPSGLRQQGSSLLERIAGWIPGPSEDPHWHRARALFLENQSLDDLLEAARQWIDYLRDIDQGAFPPQDQRLAKALVWYRAATNYLSYLQKQEDDEEQEQDEDGQQHHDRFLSRWADQRRREVSKPDMEESIFAAATAALRESINLAPELIAPYRCLAVAHAYWGRVDEAAEAYRLLIDRHPDSLIDLVSAARMLLGFDRPLEACPYARKAAQLKPLDRSVTRLFWRCLVQSARYLAGQQRLDESRAMLEEVATLDLPPEDARLLPACRAVLAFKAGNLQEARTLAWEAVRKAPHPASGYLAMAIQARLWDLPGDLATQLESQWEAQLQGRFNSKAAAAMARLLCRADDRKGESPHLAEFVRRAIDYIARGTRAKWRREYLLDVCELLDRRLESLRAKASEREDKPDAAWDDDSEDEATQVAELLRSYCIRAVRLFPGEPKFFAWLGDLMLSDGPFIRDVPYARYVFQTLATLTANATDPEMKNMYRQARDALRHLGPGRVRSRPRKRRLPLRQTFLNTIANELAKQLWRHKHAEDTEHEDEDKDACPPPR